MTELDDRQRQKNVARSEEETPEAHVHLPKWSPWIWLVPALAVFIVAWLVVRYGFGGGDITVRFADARGLERYSPVRFRGAKVGTVQKITIDKDLGQVAVRISMDSSMNHALKKGTRFWIVEPGLGGGGLGGLLSGTYVGIAPGDGADASEFAGQEYAPILSPAEAGKTFILEAKGLGSIAVGSPVTFQGIRVGSILGAEYDEGRGVTSVHAFVVQRFVNDVRESTRFWRAGGLNVSFGGGGLSMGGTSISSLLTAPVAFYTPEVMAGAPVPEHTRFQLYESEGMAEAAADGPHLTYQTFFHGPVKGLAAGTPVQMNGVAVGHVRDVRLRYVPSNATLITPVTLEIDPRKLEFDVTAATTREDLRARMNDAMQKLVQKGMRSSLASSLVLPGSSAVTLDMAGKPGTGQLDLSHDPPIIPSAAGGSGLEGALSAISDVAGTIRALPLQEIAGNLRNASQRLDTLLGDPALHDSVQRLNNSLRDIEKVASTTRANIGPITDSLRSAAESADTAAKRAQQLLGSAPRQNYDLGALVQELTKAAESVRALATYLSENPDALLKGRSK